MNHFADRLRQARNLRGMSQSALAKACGLSQGAIANYENKTRQTAKGIFQLAEALRVNPAWLAQGIGPMEAVDPVEAPHSTYRLSDHAHAAQHGLWPFKNISPDVYWSLSRKERNIMEDTMASLIRSFRGESAQP